MLGWEELLDGGRLGRGPVLHALDEPIAPAGAPGHGAEGVDWAAGLLAGREGGVDIWFCCGTEVGAPCWFIPT